MRLLADDPSTDRSLVPVSPVATDRLRQGLEINRTTQPGGQVNPAVVYLSRLRAGSRPSQRGALEAMARIVSGGSLGAVSFPWHRLSYVETQALRTRLADSYAPATTNRMLCALRGTLKEAWRLGQMDAEAYRRATDLQGVRSHALPTGRALRKAEVRSLLDACDGASPRPIDLRDQALVALLFTSGLRRAESVNLDLADYDAEEDALVVRHGKGDKARTVYVPAAKDQLAAWLAVRGPIAGPLFLPVTKTGSIVSRRLSPQTIRDILGKRAEQAGVASFTPHDARRTVLTNLLDQSVDVLVVQQVAGHASPATTSKYDRRGERAKREAAKRLSL